MAGSRSRQTTASVQVEMPMQPAGKAKKSAAKTTRANPARSHRPTIPVAALTPSIELAEESDSSAVSSVAPATKTKARSKTKATGKYKSGGKPKSKAKAKGLPTVVVSTPPPTATKASRSRARPVKTADSSDNDAEEDTDFDQLSDAGSVRPIFVDMTSTGSKRRMDHNHVASKKGSQRYVETLDDATETEVEGSEGGEEEQEDVETAATKTARRKGTAAPRNRTKNDTMPANHPFVLDQLNFVNHAVNRSTRRIALLVNKRIALVRSEANERRAAELERFQHDEVQRLKALALEQIEQQHLAKYTHAYGNQNKQPAASRSKQPQQKQQDEVDDEEPVKPETKAPARTKAASKSTKRKKPTKKGAKAKLATSVDQSEDPKMSARQAALARKKQQQQHEKGSGDHDEIESVEGEQEQSRAKDKSAIHKSASSSSAESISSQPASYEMSPFSQESTRQRVNRAAVEKGSDLDDITIPDDDLDYTQIIDPQPSARRVQTEDLVGSSSSDVSAAIDATTSSNVNNSITVAAGKVLTTSSESEKHASQKESEVRDAVAPINLQQSQGSQSQKDAQGQPEQQQRQQRQDQPSITENTQRRSRLVGVPRLSNFTQGAPSVSAPMISIGLGRPLPRLKDSAASHAHDSLSSFVRPRPLETSTTASAKRSLDSVPETDSMTVASSLAATISKRPKAGARASPPKPAGSSSQVVGDTGSMPSGASTTDGNRDSSGSKPTRTTPAEMLARMRKGMMANAPPTTAPTAVVSAQNVSSLVESDLGPVGSQSKQAPSTAKDSAKTSQNAVVSSDAHANKSGRSVPATQDHTDVRRVDASSNLVADSAPETSALPASTKELIPRPTEAASAKTSQETVLPKISRLAAKTIEQHNRLSAESSSSSGIVLKKAPNVQDLKQMRVPTPHTEKAPVAESAPATDVTSPALFSPESPTDPAMENEIEFVESEATPDVMSPRSAVGVSPGVPALTALGRSAAVASADKSPSLKLGQEAEHPSESVVRQDSTSGPSAAKSIPKATSAQVPKAGQAFAAPAGTALRKAAAIHAKAAIQTTGQRRPAQANAPTVPPQTSDSSASAPSKTQDGAPTAASSATSKTNASDPNDAAAAALSKMKPKLKSIQAAAQAAKREQAEKERRALLRGQREQGHKKPDTGKVPAAALASAAGSKRMADDVPNIPFKVARPAVTATASSTASGMAPRSNTAASASSSSGSGSSGGISSARSQPIPLAASLRQQVHANEWITAPVSAASASAAVPKKKLPILAALQPTGKATVALPAQTAKAAPAPAPTRLLAPTKESILTKPSAKPKKGIATIVDEHGNLPEPPSEDDDDELSGSEEGEIGGDKTPHMIRQQEKGAGRKDIASWANTPAIRQALQRQQQTDPDAIFGPIQPISLEQVFVDGAAATKREFRKRSSSAHWLGADALTHEENMEYKQRMGYLEDGDGGATSE